MEILLFVTDTLRWIALYAIVTLSLNLEAGYAGIPNFGKALSVAIGAFVAGAFSGRLAGYLLGVDTTGYSDPDKNALIISNINKLIVNEPLVALVVMLTTLLLAILIGAIVGYLASYPAIRLRQDYLAITLLAIAEGVRLVGYNYTHFVGGTRGLYVPNVFRAFTDNPTRLSALVMVIFASLVFLYIEKTLQSPLGRVLRAIRDDEKAAEALGKDVTRFRVKTIIVSSAIAAIAGVLDVFDKASIVPATYDRVTWTFIPWALMMLGGAANNKGVILGVLAYVIGSRMIYLYKYKLMAIVPFDVVWLEKILLGILIILILMFRPQGILPEEPTKTIDLKSIVRKEREPE